MIGLSEWSAIASGSVRCCRGGRRSAACRAARALVAALALRHFGLRRRAEFLAAARAARRTAICRESWPRRPPAEADHASPVSTSSPANDVSARWWAAFQSPALNDLIRQSVEHNPTLQSAEAAIKVAYYNALAQRGVYFPQLTGNATSAQYLIANPGQVPPIPTEGAQSEYSLVTHPAHDQLHSRRLGRQRFARWKISTRRLKTSCSSSRRPI